MEEKNKVAETLLGLVVVVLAGWLLVKCTSGDSEAEKKAAAEKAAACKTDLQCIGDKLSMAAGFKCPQEVERLAKYSVKWTDGTLEPKFSRFRWFMGDEKSGVVTLIGDKAQFQNGFGAFAAVVYECDMTVDGESVLDVRVREGRLPS